MLFLCYKLLDYIKIHEKLNMARMTLAIFNGFVPQPTWNDQTREELYALCWAAETVKYMYLNLT